MATETAASRYLKAHGPSPMAEMPCEKLDVKDRIAGIWKFYGKWSKASASTGGNTVDVFYLRDVHWPKQVVRAWFVANTEAVERLPVKSLRSVLYRNGDEFREPINDLLREVGK